MTADKKLFPQYDTICNIERENLYPIYFRNIQPSAIVFIHKMPSAF